MAEPSEKDEGKPASAKRSADEQQLARSCRSSQRKYNPNLIFSRATEDEKKLLALTYTKLAEGVLASKIGESYRHENEDGDKDANGEMTAERKHELVRACLLNYSFGLTVLEEQAVVYRTLSVNGFDVDATVTRLIGTAEFRMRQNLNRMALFPSLIPIRGYNEQDLCEHLHLPYLDDWQLTVAGTAPGALPQSVDMVDEDGRLQLQPNNELDDFYNVSYTNYDHASETPQTSAGRPSNSLVSQRLPSDAGSDADHGRMHTTHSFSMDDNGGDSNPAKHNSFSGNKGWFHRSHRLSQGSPHQGDEDTSSSPQQAKSVFTRFFTHIIPSVFTEASAKASETSHGSPRADGRRSNEGSEQGDGPLRTNGGGGGRSFDRISDTDVREKARIVDQQTSAFVNAAGASKPLLSTPNNQYADSLNFHALLQPIVTAISRYLPVSFHYWDKEGRPVLYFRLCNLRAKRLVAELFRLTPVSTEPKALALLYNAYILEILRQLIRFNNWKNLHDNEIREALLTGQPSSPELSRKKSGLPRQKNILPSKEPVTSCVVVIDCAKTKMRRFSYKPLTRIIHPLISLDQEHYPAILHHMYIVNSNAAVNMAYLGLRGVVKERTRRKITFCSHRKTLSTLKTSIDPDLLPKELGGRCECPGGCVPQLQTRAESASMSSFGMRGSPPSADDDDILSESLEMSQTVTSLGGPMQRPTCCTAKQLTVRPRKKATLFFPVAAREDIFWEFRCHHHRPIAFSAMYIPATDDGELFSLITPERSKEGASHYVCPHAGTVVLEWENQYCLIHQVRIHAKVYHETLLMSPH